DRVNHTVSVQLLTSVGPLPRLVTVQLTSIGVPATAWLGATTLLTTRSGSGSGSMWIVLIVMLLSCGHSSSSFLASVCTITLTSPRKRRGTTTGPADER